MGVNQYELKGHLIDEGILAGALKAVELAGASFFLDEVDIARKKEDKSYVLISVSGDESALAKVASAMKELGALAIEGNDAKFAYAPADMTLPDGFYSTTNLETWVKLSGKWVKAEDQRMDAALVVVGGVPYCRKMRKIRKGDGVVLHNGGVRVVALDRKKKKGAFTFMDSNTSSEKNNMLMITKMAQEMKEMRKRNGRIVIVLGPAAVHTGGSEALASMVRKGFVSCVLSGNAGAVHDMEYGIFGSSLGVCMHSGVLVENSTSRHIATINEIMKAGSMKAAVEKGVLKKGLFHECIKQGVPFVLAGSIRDDGPLPEVITDSMLAQEEYAKQLRGAELVLMLASTLHSVAVGNMLPASVETVCVDINPAVVTKLMDRGSGQAVGIVTDVGLFLRELDRQL